MIYYIFLSFLVSLGFMYFNVNQIKQVTVIQSVWHWDKKNQSDEYGTDSRLMEKESSPYKILTGYYTSSGKPFLFSIRKSISGDDNEIYEMPVLGNGFLSYKKIGEKITYYSRVGEILWKKQYQSYPFSSPNGVINFLVSGDGNQILIIDINGNLTGAKQLDGRFLTDISSSVKNGSVVLFSGGELFRLDNLGNIIYKLNEENSKEFQFYKSSAISEDGSKVLIHYLENDTDYISMYENKNILKYKIKLDNVYPHKIFMSVANNGNSVLNLRDKIVFLNLTGNIIKKYDKNKSDDVYQIIFSNGKIFSAGKEDEILFFENNGDIFYRTKISSNKQRINASNYENIFFQENSNEITQYYIFKE